MKTIQQKANDAWTKYKKWLPFIAVFVLVFLFETKGCKSENKAPGEPKTAIYETLDTTGEKHYKKEIAVNDKSDFSKAEIDKLKKALALKDNQIKAITTANATLKDSLKIKSITLDSLNNKIWTWSKVEPEKSEIKASMNEKDSILHIEANIKVQTVDYIEKHWFKKDKLITDFYSSDQNIKFNGVQIYRSEKIIQPKRFGIGLQMGYGLGSNFQIFPYVGIGASYNLIRF